MFDDNTAFTAVYGVVLSTLQRNNAFRTKKTQGLTIITAVWSLNSQDWA